MSASSKTKKGKTKKSGIQSSPRRMQTRSMKNNNNSNDNSDSNKPVNPFSFGVILFQTMKRITGNNRLDKPQLKLFNETECDIIDCKDCDLGFDVLQAMETPQQFKNLDWYLELEAKRLWKFKKCDCRGCMYYGNCFHPSDTILDKKCKFKITGNGKVNEPFTYQFTNGLKDICAYENNSGKKFVVRHYNADDDATENTFDDLKKVFEILTDKKYFNYFVIDQNITITERIFKPIDVSNVIIIPFEVGDNIGIYIYFKNLSKSPKLHSNLDKLNLAKDPNAELENIGVAFDSPAHVFSHS